MKKLFICLFVSMLCTWTFAQQHHTFEKGTLGPEWCFIGEPDSSKYTFMDGRLRLFGSIYELYEDKPVTFTGFRQQSAQFEATTKLTLLDTEYGDEAGLCVYRSPKGYIQLCIEGLQSGHRLKLKLRLLSHYLQMGEQYIGSNKDVWLRVKSDSEKIAFLYSTNGTNFRQIGFVEQRLIAPDIVGGEQHTYTGMYAYTGSTKYSAGYTFADFDFFDYDETK